MARTKKVAAPAPEGGEAATVKVKKERLFTTSLNLSEIRKNEQKVAGKFNRLGRAVKAIGLSAEAEASILGILATEFEAKAKEVFVAAPAPASMV